MCQCASVCVCRWGETVSVGVLYGRFSVYLCVSVYRKGYETVNIGVLC